MLNLSPVSFVITFFCLIVAVTIHEFSHAFAADKLGDPTPRLQGRITLNPLVHLDPIGTIMILLIGFGWGKPVQFDPYNLRNMRKDSAIISFAGPCSNFIIAIFCSILIKLFIMFHILKFDTIGFELIATIVSQMIQMNVVLGVFNLLPVHPLDGFKIVGGLLPAHKAKEWYGLERYGLLFLLALIIPLGNTSMLDSIIRPIVFTVLRFLLPSI